jgi:ATP-dependent Lhr-like helicase
MAIQEGAHLQTAEIRRRLSHTWTAFFSRFGRLTEVQRRTIPLVLERFSLTVSAPTATGKTEAIVAPLAELHKMHRWQGLAVLYIVPTKALANDILSRISEPLADIGISLALKHGDKPQLSIRALPDWLVTTPESLDSILCRKPKAVQDIEAIILDEIHLLDCTYRGDQLRILLKRLAQLRAGFKPQVCLISATLGNPQTVGARYTELCQTVAVSGSRRIEFDKIRSWTALLQLAKKKSWTKILVFCNMRETVEAVADHLTALWKPYPVVVHHGSLSRSVRLEAETVMKEARIAVCVATSTLEVGIDIGNIDAVVLAEVPFSLSTVSRLLKGSHFQEHNREPFFQ